MSEQDLTPPVAEDDFPEFSGPPKQRPADTSEPKPDPAVDARQEGVDEVIARLRRERGEGKR